MSKEHEENKQATYEAGLAREKSYLASCKALDAARKCRVKEGETVSPEIKARAQELGKEAALARKESKEAAAKAASARRIACFKSMPREPVPEIPRSALAFKPPPRKVEE